MTDTWAQALIVYKPIELASNDIEEWNYMVKKWSWVGGDMFRRTQKYLPCQSQPCKLQLRRIAHIKNREKLWEELPLIFWQLEAPEPCTPSTIVLFHNYEQLKRLPQLQCSFDHRCRAVPSCRYIANHKNRLDFDSLALEFKICTNCWAIEDTFGKVSKLVHRWFAYHVMTNQF